jgi:hypothetical protein
MSKCLLWLVVPMVLLGSIATTAGGATPRDRGPRGADTDGDGLRDRAEVRRFHTNPRKRDTDGDGLQDGAEVRRFHTKPRKRDTDRDGLRDGAEVRRFHTNPRKRDTDGDGLRDGAEVRRFHTNPRKRDTDGDGLGDGAEVRGGNTNPRKRDTDGDGFSDRVELRKGKNPRDPGSHPGQGGSESPQAPGNPIPTPTGDQFPTGATTGVPAGTTLTAYTGPTTVTTPGTVITGKTIGCIAITVPGVIIRNSRVSCAGRVGVASGDGDYTGTPLLIEDSEIDCKLTGGTAIGDTNIVARGLNIHGCENGFDIDANVTVEDSFIHDMYNGGEAHMDGIQLAYGHFVNGQVVAGSINVTIKHNTIYGVGADGSLGTSAIISNRGGDTNILIQNNLLAGGAVALYCEQGATGVNYRVLDNHFSRAFSPNVGAYGPSTDCSDETQSGNVYHETGLPVQLP